MTSRLRSLGANPVDATDSEFPFPVEFPFKENARVNCLSAACIFCEAHPYLLRMMVGGDSRAFNNG
jgi:hypothetical protein